MKAKFNKALGFNAGSGRSKGPASKRDARVRQGPAFDTGPIGGGGGGGGDMGLRDKLVDKNTGGLSEFGQQLRDNAPSVLAARRKMEEAKQKKYKLDPFLNAKSLARRTEDEQDDSDVSGFSEEEDDDNMLASIRNQRVRELKIRSKLNAEWAKRGHGTYSEIVEEDFLKSVTDSKHAVCHFYHSDFQRCKIVDKHLAILAKKHVCAKFIKIDAAKCPFFVGKLQIRMLPTIILFTDGIAKDRLTGFEELGNKDDFDTIVMEERISQSGVIPPPPKKKKALVFGGIRGKEEDSDSDLGF